MSRITSTRAGSLAAQTCHNSTTMPLPAPGTKQKLDELGPEAFGPLAA